jgi:hypothetical protein
MKRKHCVSLTKTIAVYSGNFKKSVNVIYRQNFKVLNVKGVKRIVYTINIIISKTVRPTDENVS